MLALLLALALFPPELSVQGTPGELVSLPVMTTTDEAARIYSEGILDVALQAEKGFAKKTLLARINPSAATGNYTTHIYLLPEKDDPVLLGSASKVHVQVLAVDNTHTKTDVSFAKKISFPMLLLATLGIVIGLLFLTKTIRITKNVTARKP